MECFYKDQQLLEIMKQNQKTNGGKKNATFSFHSSMNRLKKFYISQFLSAICRRFGTTLSCIIDMKDLRPYLEVDAQRGFRRKFSLK